MPQPSKVHDLARDLLALYTVAWNRIVAEEQQIQDEWATLPRPRRMQRLETLQQVVEQLMDHADEAALRFATDDLPQAYLLGAIDSGYAPLKWADPDLHAVHQLATDTYDQLLKATRFVRRSTKILVRTLAREQVGIKLLTGQTAVQAGRELADVFANQGIAAITYANGARVGLTQYAEMLTRTQTALAYNQGNYNQFTAADIGFVECFDGPDCGLDGHDDEEKPNGRVYDLSVMDEFPISHPNCQRSWGARPDVTSAQEAADAAGTAPPRSTIPGP
jgi:hypothetical protein